MNSRYALYFVPSDDSALGEFGARLFGRWPDGRTSSTTLDLPDWQERVGRVARYGFHATLKAPFRLADGCTETRFLDAVEHGVQGWKAVAMPALSVSIDPETFALSFPVTGYTDVHHEVSELARRCVLEFERFRAPLDEASRRRRKPESLSARQRELLDAHGYPWVLDEFRFHITLGDRLESGDEAFARVVSAAYAAIVKERPVLDRISVCREPAPKEPLQRIAEFPLAAS